MTLKRQRQVIRSSNGQGYWSITGGQLKLGSAGRAADKAVRPVKNLPNGASDGGSRTMTMHDRPSLCRLLPWKVLNGAWESSSRHLGNRAIWSVAPMGPLGTRLLPVPTRA